MDESFHGCIINVAYGPWTLWCRKVSGCANNHDTNDLINRKSLKVKTTQMRSRSCHLIAFLW